MTRKKQLEINKINNENKSNNSKYRSLMRLVNEFTSNFHPEDLTLSALEYRTFQEAIEYMGLTALRRVNPIGVVLYDIAL